MCEKVMSLEEFLKVEKQDKIIRLDDTITKLTRNKKLNKLIIISLASYINLQKVVYAVGTEKLDIAGNRLLNIVRYLGKFACLFFCFAEIIKSLAEGDIKSIGKIIMKYCIAFSSFYFLPWVFDVIKECFS